MRYLSPANAQTWKSYNPVTLGILRTSVLSLSTLTSSGVPSIRIPMHLLKVGMVVNITKTEKMKVQIGSTISHLGSYIITMAAMITPIDCRRSPIR